MLLIMMTVCFQSPFLEWTCWYTGQIGDLKIQMMVTGEGNRAKYGRYFYLKHGEPIYIRAVEDKNRLRENPDGGSISGYFTNHFVPTHRVVEGTWTSADGKRTLPFKLTRVAGTLLIVRSTDWALATCTIPDFIEDHPLSAWTQKFAAEQSASQIEFLEQAKLMEGEKLEARWGLNEHYSLEFLTESVAVFLLEYAEFTGGMTGARVSSYLNLFFEGNQIREIELADVVLPEKQDALLNLLLTRFKRQDPEWFEERNQAPLNINDLAMVILPKKLRVRFAPSLVNKKEFIVELEYELLKDLVLPNGPLSSLIK